MARCRLTVQPVCCAALCASRPPPPAPSDRQIVRSPGSQVADTLDWAACFLALNSSRRDEYLAFADRITNGVNTAGSPPPFVASKHFWRTDYATHHRATCVCPSISLSQSPKAVLCHVTACSLGWSGGGDVVLSFCRVNVTVSVALDTSAGAHRTVAQAFYHLARLQQVDVQRGMCEQVKTGRGLRCPAPALCFTSVTPAPSQQDACLL
jgi:hypothetical protein